jgi:hypothetical protein
MSQEGTMSWLSTLKKLFLTGSPEVVISNHQEGKMEMTKQTEKNYTEAQEARIQELADELGGMIGNDEAMELADEFGKDVRSVRAKAVRMGVYKAKARVSKTGGKIESKEEIVAEIAELVGANLDGLEKASKQALIAIRAKLAA